MLPLLLYTLVFGIAIFIALAIVCLPPVQREQCNLQADVVAAKTRNFYLETADGKRIGIWHILPRSVYQTVTGGLPPREPFGKEVYEKALTQRPTILFFHGNAANRAVPYRIRIYTALSQQLDCNVIVTDYRGFGDSTGNPTPVGLIIDARTVYDYVTSTIDRQRIPRQGDAEAGKADILLMGHSLGTGVICLTERLRAVVLVSPFTSMMDVIQDYTTLAFLHFMARLGRIPGVAPFLKFAVKHQFESIVALPHICPTIPILLMHARNDWTIPITHSRRLFQTLRDREGPDADPADVVEMEVPHWGLVSTFKGKGGGEVMFWEGELGGHNDLGWTEGGLDLIKRIARI
ncbi:Alpha/Beta hydrolase protein [Dioszegia hungarica]|uniref:Alpha/Beta hydrolase protein n=1 Tax=Dioszegia hungarica TaxID=4972 RepID=A0AA38LVD4_9TREE|nr:Alpha/Beta hydrolase protein [Dioszegia hungarica]KAI9637095.1 Alpha/Beta hydrolase protein [Dioszegia hungarica]